MYVVSDFICLVLFKIIFKVLFLPLSHLFRVGEIVLVVFSCLRWPYVVKGKILCTSRIPESVIYIQGVSKRALQL